MKLTKIIKKPRVIILLVILFISLALINPQFNNEGVAVRYAQPLSNAHSSGLTSPEPNTQPTSLEKITEINSEKISSLQDYNRVTSSLQNFSNINIKTNKGFYSFQKDSDNLGLTVSEFPESNIRKGLELQGGTRVLLKPKVKVSQQDLNDVVSVLNNRLNVYGLTDLTIRPTTDLNNDNFILVEIASLTEEEVSSIIASQGKFEAKISNTTVFEGGKKDITFVCRNDGSCSGITSCNQDNGLYLCRFEFQISLSQEAAKKHAEVTKNIDVITSESGEQILSESIFFYLDEKEIDSLTISASLKGVEATNILISGPGTGITQEEAFADAERQMARLQAALITGSLPFELEVVQLDSISPYLGSDFLNKAILSGLAAILAVTVVIFIRFKSIKIALPMLFTMISEIFIILGFAALFKQNLDLASIAGIIASVGTGVDDQIVIIDEILFRNKELSSWKAKLKNAFFIIMAAYFATVAAMLPLFRASAGLIRGFAFVTIVGVTIGVLLTRPAFASIIEVLKKEEE